MTGENSSCYSKWLADIDIDIDIDIDRDIDIDKYSLSTIAYLGTVLLSKVITKRFFKNSPVLFPARLGLRKPSEMKNIKNNHLGKANVMAKSLPPLGGFPAEFLNGVYEEFFLQPNWFVFDHAEKPGRFVADNNAWMSIVHDQFSLGVSQVCLDVISNGATDGTEHVLKADPAAFSAALVRFERLGFIHIRKRTDWGAPGKPTAHEALVEISYPHVLGESHPRDEARDAMNEFWQAEDDGRPDLYPVIFRRWENFWSGNHESD